MTRGQRMARRFCIHNVLIIEPNHQCLDSRLMLRWIMNLPETQILKTCLVKNVQGKACAIIPKINISLFQKKKLTTSRDSPDLFAMKITFLCHEKNCLTKIPDLFWAPPTSRSCQLLHHPLQPSPGAKVADEAGVALLGQVIRSADGKVSIGFFTSKISS